MARRPRDQKRDKLTSQKLIYQSYGQIGMMEVRDDVAPLPPPPPPPPMHSCACSSTTTGFGVACRVADRCLVHVYCVLVSDLGEVYPIDEDVLVFFGIL